MSLKNILLAIFCFAFSIHSKAQLYGKEDSLLTAYKKGKADTNQVKTINHLVNVFLYSEPEKAKEFIEEGLILSNKLNYQKGQNMFLYQKGAYYTNLPNYDSAVIAYNQALKYAILIKDQRAVVRAMNGKAVVKIESGHYDEAIQLLNETIPFIHETEDTLTLAVTYSHLANSYKAKGYTKVALEYIQRSIKELKTLDAEMRLADAYYLMGDLEVDLNHYEDAFANYEKAAVIYRKQKDYYFLTELLYSLSWLSVKKEDWIKAVKMLDSTRVHANSHGFDYILGKVANLNAQVQLAKGNYQEAERFVNQTLKEARRQGDKLEEANALSLKGKLLNKMGRAAQAIPLHNESLKYFEENNVLGGLIFVYENRSESYKNMGKYNLALNDIEAYKLWSDSSANIAKTKQIEELRIIFDTEQKEAEIENLALEVDKSNLQKSLFAGGMFSAICIAGLLYFGFRQRSKRTKAEFEQKEALVKSELAFKRKELVTQTLHLVNKNALIEDLKNDLKEIRKTSETHTKEIGKIIKDLQQENASDANWEVFKSHFAAVHNDFDIKLRSRAPDITDNEIRLAAFIKMKLSTKEIAGMLNVQPESVTKSKYRLKKKFNLDADEDFDVFLDQI